MLLGIIDTVICACAVGKRVSLTAREFHATMTGVADDIFRVILQIGISSGLPVCAEFFDKTWQQNKKNDDGKYTVKRWSLYYGLLVGYRGRSTNSSRRGGGVHAGQEFFKGAGSGSSKRQVRANILTDKHKKNTGGGGGVNTLTHPPPPVDPLLGKNNTHKYLFQDVTYRQQVFLPLR